MKKILTIIGARPQFVKAAVLSRLIKSNSWNNNFEEILVHTGQHYDENMSDVFFNEMEIPKPDYNLEVGSGRQGEMTGEMLNKIELLLLKEKPDYLLVYGDTNSTLAGALAGSKLHIPIIHIEAGLRSFNNRMPEEINRVLTDRISNLLFTPTITAKNHLINEGITEGVHLVGDIMQDASLYYRTKNKSTIITDLKIKYAVGSFVLATIHRAENTDDKNRLNEIIQGLGLINKKVILPLHPRTKKQIELFEIEIPDNLIVIDPVGYFDMLALESECDCIFTDSGGVQKEAYFFKKPCFTLRDETEWVETVDAGWNVLVEANQSKILDSFNTFKIPEHYPKLYGEGNTAKKILKVLIKEE